MLFYKEDSIIILSSQVTPALLCSHSKLLWLHLLQALGVLKKMQFNLVTGTWWVSGTSWMKMLLKCEGAPKWHHSEIKEVNTSTTADFPKTECRESQFYSLSFRQAVAGSKVVLISSPLQILTRRIDYSSSVIWFILKVYLPIRQIKNRIH